MKINSLKSTKGLTLVELLAALALFGIISTIIISVVVSSMNNYKRVNDEILLHDEANYVMTRFVEKIYAASKVEVETQSGCTSLVKITNLVKDNGGQLVDETVILGFENHNAVVDGEPIQSDSYSFSCDSPTEDPDKTNESRITVNDDTVSIKMSIKDNQSEKTFELNNEVSFEKIE
ncbi:prepilin-type N-terminal cleavage/methylation domain-containing protein [Bacillus massilinigeriensis]|uniref:prepilin-type N-terminal cleavage/methylation domain-containing protein n=1 Tax=Bacillus massilionigeriensis TaxID=1805475 RepID=UPI00096B41B3|nr:prepilin-type N-terminal cleavage/methylation domain-containing protein [Bacillus massilionigeriensis]